MAPEIVQGHWRRKHQNLGGTGIYFGDSWCARSAHARERVSARIYGWGPGAEPLAGVQGAEPPEALGFRLSNPSNGYI